MPGTSNIAGILDNQQTQLALQQQQAIIDAAQVGAVRDNQFVFFAGFDGTLNDRGDTTLSGNPLDTNVAQLTGQAEDAGLFNQNVVAKYYAGVGTQDTEWASAALPTGQAIATAQKAYNDFVKAADDWLNTDATRSVDDITAAFTSFSRGYASAAIFSQMVYEKGLVTQDGRILALPGQVGISAGVAFDPVTTYVTGNMAMAPGTENVVVIQAQAEFRYLFKGADLSDIAGLRTLDFLGNHCDIGGGYDDGLAGLILVAGTRFLQLSGLTIADVNPDRLPNFTTLNVHTEEGIILDNSGNIIGRKWDVYDNFNTNIVSQATRLLEDVTIPSQTTYDTDSTTVNFTAYNGNRITLTTTPETLTLGNYTDTPTGEVGMFNTFDLSTGELLKTAVKYTIPDSTGNDREITVTTDKQAGETSLATTDADGTTHDFGILPNMAQIASQTVDHQKAIEGLTNLAYGQAASFINSIHYHDKFGQVLNGIKLVNTLAIMNGQGFDINPDSDFVQVTGGLGAAAGILHSLDALGSNNALAQINGMYGLITNSNNLYAFTHGTVDGLVTDKLNIDILNKVGAVISLVNFVSNLDNFDDMMANGQVGSVLSSFTGAYQAGVLLTQGLGSAALLNPATLLIVAVASFVLDELFGDEEEEQPLPPPVGEAVFIPVTDASGHVSISYKISNPYPGNEGVDFNLGKQMLTNLLNGVNGEPGLLATITRQITDANAQHQDPQGNTDHARDLVLVASRMPKITIQSWPVFEGMGNGESNYFYVLTQTNPRTGNAEQLGMANEDMLRHYVTTMVYPEAVIQQWEADHLQHKFGNDQTLWQTEGQWLHDQSSIEATREQLQLAKEQAQTALDHAKKSLLDTDLINTDYTTLLAQKIDTQTFGMVTDSTDATGKAEALKAAAEALAAAKAAAIAIAQTQLDAAEHTLAVYEQQHPFDAQLAAHVIDSATQAQIDQLDPVKDSDAIHDLISNTAYQQVKLITVDMGDAGIGIQSLPMDELAQQDLYSLQYDGVARFDVDNDGYREATQWVGPTDAILGIDRDGNGVLDSASELLNGINTPYDQRGLASLAYYDSNNDHKIDTNDVVYNQLRIWHDFNGDGSAGDLETFNLKMQHPRMDAAVMAAALAENVSKAQALLVLAQASGNAESIAAAEQQLADATAAQDANMNLTTNRVITGINLDTAENPWTVLFADGTSTSLSEQVLTSETQGIMVAYDNAGENPTYNISILRENGSRENYITLIEDLTQLLALKNPENLSAEKIAQLEALATKYGLDTRNPNFFTVLNNLMVGGQNVSSSGPIYISQSVTDPLARERIEATRFSFNAFQNVSEIDIANIAYLGTPIWTASNEVNIFNDNWRLAHTVVSSEVVGDTQSTVTAPPRNEQWVLPGNVYNLDFIVKGVQEGGLVTQQAVLASKVTSTGTTQQLLQVYTTATPVSTLAAVTINGSEDQQFAFGVNQLAQEARNLLGGVTATTTITVLGVREVRHGTVEMVDGDATNPGTIRFIPDPDYYGTDAGFTYVVKDNLGRVIARKVNFNLLEVNDAPTILGETINAAEDVPLLIDTATLLANDTDKEGDTLKVMGIGRVGMGKAVLQSNGQIYYVPPGDLYDVTDTIEYMVQDSRGATSYGVIKITLNGRNDAPTVVSEVVRRHEPAYRP